MGELKRDKHSSSYSVKVEDAEDFFNICDYDNIVSTQKALFERLSEINGVFDVDYNGHFGSRIWLSVDEEYNSEGTWIDIFRTIHNYIIEAKEEKK